MRHGEVWVAQLPKEIKPRPVLILSRDSMSARRPEITVAYITGTVRNQPFEVPLTPAEDGVICNCVINLDAINTIPKNWLVKRVSMLSTVRMIEVRNAVLFALDL